MGGGGWKEMEVIEMLFGPTNIAIFQFGELAKYMFFQ